MARVCSGRIKKAKRGKNAPKQQHQKNHRWESFTAKISKLHSLDSLKKVLRHDLEAEDVSARTSYFRNGLQRWGELNIAKEFVAFKQETLPLSDSLAQIIYFEKRIMKLFVKHISAHDKDSLEPLLDLLTAFARDLDHLFEKHYHQALLLIVDLAGKPQEADVIEWTFGTLAFLFKRLSRLLVPDLRPTYNVISPLLGKAKHPPHIARFAAEAMSFLIKKAAVPAHKDTSLRLVIESTRRDLYDIHGTRDFDLFQDGLMTMYAEAMKGPGDTLHSTAASVFTALLDAVPVSDCSLSDAPIWTNVTCGVLTSLIHHSSASALTTIVDATCSHFETTRKGIGSQSQDEVITWPRVYLIRLLGALSSVRKGTKVEGWQPVVKTLNLVLEESSKAGYPVPDEKRKQFWDQVVASVAYVWAHAPTSTLAAHILLFTKMMSQGPLMPWYIPFCAFVSDLDLSRFKTLFLSSFKGFVSNNWSVGNSEDLLCVYLPRLANSGALQPAHGAEAAQIPREWQHHIVGEFEQLQDSTFPEQSSHGKDRRFLPKYASLLAVLELSRSSLSEEVRTRISDFLLTKLRVALKPSSSIASDDVHFIVSQGFRAYLNITAASSSGPVDSSLDPLLEAAVPRFRQSIGFVETFLSYRRHVSAALSKGQTERSPESPVGGDDDPVASALIDNLRLSSHDLRLASLKLLLTFEDPVNNHEALDTMIEMEETTLTLANSRKLTMLLRKLGQIYPKLEQNSPMSKAVPSFLFGMTTVKMSPVWDGAVEALQEVGKTKHGEEAVASLAFDWLYVPSPKWTGSQPVYHGSRGRFVSDFECTNVKRLEEQSQQSFAVVADAAGRMQESFNEQQRTVEAHISQARSRSLMIVAALPIVVERRSRKFVPLFLEWAGQEDEGPGSTILDGNENVGGRSWSLADRKSMLRVFGHFKNPAALYENQRVYQALLRLLENGDVELQRLSLQAIVAWKQAGVKSYAESLENILDDAKFRGEVTNLLQGDNAIQSQHRAVLMPVLLRLLYGRSISRKGPGSGRQGFQSTRLAVLRNLTVEDVGEFLDIAAGPLKDVRVVVDGDLNIADINRELVTMRRLHGFLNMMAPLIIELGSNVSHYSETLVNSVLYGLFFACNRLHGVAEDAQDAGENDDQPSNISMLKAMRSNGIKCLISLFRSAPNFNWNPYSSFIVEVVLTPRIPNLPAESGQGVSGLLQLLSTWAALPRAAMFLGINDATLAQVVDCIAVEKGKEEVKTFVMGIIQSLVRLTQAPAAESEFNELIRAELLEPVMDKILGNIAHLLQLPSTSTFLLETCVATIIDVAPLVDKPERVQELLAILTRFLQEPARRIKPKTKGQILLVLEKFVALQDDVSKAPGSSSLLDQVYESLARLFSYFKDRQNRESLGRVLAVLATKDSRLAEVAGLCQDLNSFVEGRLDEPDDDRRMRAFNTISRKREVNYTPRQWLCLVHNLIFLIEDDEEFTILPSNSADALQKLISDAACSQGGDVKAAFEDQLENILLPAVYKGVRESSETARRQYLRVMTTLVSEMPDWAPVADMQPLLGNGADDDSVEPSFFFDLLISSAPKQLDAMRMLQGANETSQFRSHNISHFFIPLLENFIFGRADKSDDHGLSAQASNVIGNLAASLEWKHFRSIFLRYSSYIASRPDHPKAVVRLLSKLSDALATASVPDAEEMDVDGTTGVPSRKGRLGDAIPIQEKLTGDVVNNFLPALLKHLHEKDESEVSYRVPVGVVIVRLLKLLPPDQMGSKLAPVLTDICHILRSKQDESRDMARDTLVQIALILGSQYFDFILRELRGALRRGYQLHVLSYTLHSILLSVIPEFVQGSLDHCLPSIVAIIMDDIFGVIGQEKDAQDYTAKMKEIKSSKSQDSMELISKTTSINHLIVLIRPLHALLLQKVDVKMARKIDTLLTRISSGLLHNPSAESQDTLVFCYEVVQEVYKNQQAAEQPKMDRKTRRYLIPVGAAKTDRGVTTKHTYKLVRFAIEVLLKVWKRHESLRNASYISGFIPVLGDGLVDGEAEVKVAVFKLLQAIVKVPFPDGSKITGLYKVAVKEATRIVGTSSSVKSEATQEALKLVSVVLRDRRDVVVKDAAVDLLVGKVRDDLTDPQHRDVLFKFLRCVLDRKVASAPVYDVLDHVGQVLVTNEDDQTRALARGCFVQFLLEYDQTSKRWTRQLDHLVANLKYDRKDGRLSVMEVINLLMQKTRDSYRQQMASTCFLPLVMVVANDDHKDCRGVAGELVRRVFSRADKENRTKFLTLIRSWLANKENEAVSILALQVFGFYFASDSDSRKEKDLPVVLERIMEIFDGTPINELEEDVVLKILDLIRILAAAFPSEMFLVHQEELWQQARRCMIHPQESVRMQAVGLMFKTRDTDDGPVIAGLLDFQLNPSTTEELVGLSIRILSTPTMSEELATKAGKMLEMLGPKLPRTSGAAAEAADSESDEEEEEDEEEDEEGDEVAEKDDHVVATKKTRAKDLHFLIWKLSYILRQHITPRADAINGKLAALQTLRTLCQKLPADAITPSAATAMLVPLQHLTDPAVPVPKTTDEAFRERHGRLRDGAAMLLEALRRRLGTAEFSTLSLAVRGRTRETRRERSRKKRVAAVVDPEGFGRFKRRKLEKKKERRREVGREHKAMRQSYKS